MHVPSVFTGGIYWVPVSALDPCHFSCSVISISVVLYDVGNNFGFDLNADVWTPHIPVLDSIF